eukprot:TRINITY_DN2389_c1_g1_i4.p1 TRINITY_DN2389_c1_g1~~TRINITY_DN2389_c1_g1_i4.p1  ORF type:complete len:577 (-),score=158.80 TRINITY_DN2389_c1_g1_i4:654-2156(-)
MSTTAAPVSAQLSAGENFNYWRAWWPVAIAEDLQPDVPERVELLGEALVLWRDSNKQWRAAVDRCPHRMAPLSEGIIHPKTGNLMCTYHGWEFDGDGTCTNIPQATTDAAAASRRACAQSVPVQIATGLVWVWPDTSPEGLAESKTKHPAIVADMDLPDYNGYWYVRDQPYSYDVLIENLGDPAHLPFAHHGVISNRKSGAPLGITMEPPSALFGPDAKNVHANGGYLSKPFAFMPALRDTPNMVMGFEPPTLFYYKSTYTGDMLQDVVRRLPLPPPFKALGRFMVGRDTKKNPDKPLHLYFVGYSIPTMPGKSRLILRNCRNFLTFLGKKSRAADHIRQHLVLDGDNALLHYEEREYDRLGVKDRLESSLYLPTDADTPVRAWRQWYQKNKIQWARGVEDKGGDKEAVPPREVLLERYHAHTKHCSACRATLAATQKKRKLSLGAAAVLLAIAAALPGGTRASVAAAAMAVAAAGASYRQQQHEREFHYVEYIHAKRDV